MVWDLLSVGLFSVFFFFMFCVGVILVLVIEVFKVKLVTFDLGVKLTTAL